MSNESTSAERKFVCEECGTRWASENDLKIHQAVNHAPRCAFTNDGRHYWLQLLTMRRIPGIENAGRDPTTPMRMSLQPDGFYCVHCREREE